MVRKRKIRHPGARPEPKTIKHPPGRKKPRKTQNKAQKREKAVKTGNKRAKTGKISQDHARQGLTRNASGSIMGGTKATLTRAALPQKEENKMKELQLKLTNEETEALEKAIQYAIRDAQSDAEAKTLEAVQRKVWTAEQEDEERSW